MEHPQWLLPDDAAPDTPAHSERFVQAPAPLVLQFEPQFGELHGPQHRVLLSTHQYTPVGPLLGYYAQYAGLPASLDGVDFSCLNATLQTGSTPAMWSLEQGDVIRVYATGQAREPIESYTMGATPQGQFRCNFRGCGMLYTENSDELLRHMNVHYNTQGLFHCTHANCPLVFTLESELASHLAEHTALSPLINMAQSSPRRLTVSKSTQTTPEPGLESQSPTGVTTETSAATSTDDFHEGGMKDVKPEPVSQESPPVIDVSSSHSSQQSNKEEEEQDSDEDSGEESDRAFQCPEPGCDARFERRIHLAQHKTMMHPAKIHNNRPPPAKRLPQRGGRQGPRKATKAVPKLIVLPATKRSGKKALTGKMAARASARLLPKKAIEPTEPDPDRPHQCEFPGCGMTFKRGEHLKRHFSSKHSTTKYYVCPVTDCGREFTRKDNRNQHLGKHIRTKQGLKEIEDAGLLRYLKGLSPPPKEPKVPIEAVSLERTGPRKRALSSEKIDKTLVWRLPGKPKKHKGSADESAAAGAHSKSSDSKAVNESLKVKDATTVSNSIPAESVSTSSKTTTPLPQQSSSPSPLSTPKILPTTTKRAKKQPSPPTPLSSQNAPTISYSKHTSDPVSKHEKESQVLGREEHIGVRTRSVSRRHTQEETSEGVEETGAQVVEEVKSQVVEDAEAQLVDDTAQVQDTKVDGEADQVNDHPDDKGLLYLLEQAVDAITERDAVTAQDVSELEVAEQLSHHLMKAPEIERGVPQEEIAVDETPKSTTTNVNDDNAEVFEDAVEHQVEQNVEKDDEVYQEASQELPDNIPELKNIQPPSARYRTRSHSVPLVSIVAVPKWVPYTPSMPPPMSPTDESQEPTSPIATSPITPKSRRGSISKSSTAMKSPRSMITGPKICQFCHVTTSKQWRHGPNGERLCNACGLYYNKHGRMRELKSSPLPEPPIQFIQVVHDDVQRS